MPVTTSLTQGVSPGLDELASAAVSLHREISSRDGELRLMARWITDHAHPDDVPTEIRDIIADQGVHWKNR